MTKNIIQFIGYEESHLVTFYKEDGLTHMLSESLNTDMTTKHMVKPEYLEMEINKYKEDKNYKVYKPRFKDTKDMSKHFGKMLLPKNF